MKVVISVLVLAAVALAAPTLDQGALPLEAPALEHDHLREKRSNYGPAYYSPCGAAVPVPVAPPAYHIAPIHHGGYGAPAYNYGLPHYRADMGDEQEMMSFSDMDGIMSEHMPMARYAYGAPAPVHYGAGVSGLGGAVLAPSSSGSAIGVFPNANPGGCNVPLLLSCSPSIVPGRIVKGQSSYSYAAPNAYRDVDESLHHAAHEHNLEDPTHEHMAPAHDGSHQ